MHIQLDPVGGMAGDMFVAAVLDAFPELEPRVQAALRAAGLPDRFRCELRAHSDHALNGKQFLVLEAASGPGQAAGQASGHHPGHHHEHRDHHHEHHEDHEHGHQPFSAIRDHLNAAPLEPEVRDHAVAIFTALAEAEAQVHAASLETVTFHELGEWDSIADIVAAAVLIHALSTATWTVGPLPLGSGFVKSAHGLLPVPAPAAALLLCGLQVRDDGIGGERVTPTGAAIARYLRSRPGDAPRVRVIRSAGLGFGTRSLEGMANCLRALVFDPSDASGGSEGEVTVIEFEIDDQTPEDLAIGLDHLRAHHDVLDVLQTAAVGKKGRVVIAVRVLCRPAAEAEVARMCFSETTTLGLRLAEVRRHTLHRFVEATTVLGRALDVKRAERGSQVTFKVEADRLRDVAGHHERERLRRAAEDQ